MLCLVKILVSFLVFFVSYNDAQLSSRIRLPMRAAVMLRQRLQNKISQYRARNTQRICYEIVGCFDLPHSRSPLQKIPEDPASLETKFFLFRRDLDFSKPEILSYEKDGKSLQKSSFNYSQPLKMFIHGYMSNWNEKGALIGASSFLKLYDCNMIIMDWSHGAKGPQYAQAAANTEVVGRLLGLLLLKMVEKGLDPKDIHLLGFSLGAHVAGTASEILKRKSHLIGRITGLDAASPLFRSNHFRERYKKLDKSDAKFVDVLHTDSSPSVTDGFGLWQPIGHVDFFPNGGQEQPGCTDTKSSVVVSSFEKSLTREIACSHIRAWHLYQETLLNKINNSNSCQFTAFSCPGGLPSYERGHCFPQLDKEYFSLDPAYRSEVGVFGEDAKGEGVMYFTTSDQTPFCGSQLQASVQISQKTSKTIGDLHLELLYAEERVNFQIHCEFSDAIMSGSRMNGLAVAPYKTLNAEINELSANLNYVAYNAYNNTMPQPLFLDRITIRDMYANSWHYCASDTRINENSITTVTLSKKFC